MEDQKVRKISGYSSISEETRESLTRLISALMLTLVAPVITFIVQGAMATDGNDAFRFGIAIVTMAMPLVLSLLWAINVLRLERRVWRKQSQRRSRPLFRRVKRGLYLALLIGCPVSGALIIWHLIGF